MKILSALVLAAVAAVAAAEPSRYSYASMGATNLDLTYFINTLDFQYSNTGGYVQSSIDRSFIGLDGSGQEQTMRFTATASAEATYTRLRTRTEGKVENTYYNPSNDPYYYPGEDANGNGQVDYDELILNEDGSPDSFSAVGYAAITDDVAFSGNVGLGYTAQYIFYIDGLISGDFVFPTLGFQIANYSEESKTLEDVTGRIGQYYATQKYAITPAVAQTVTSRFTTQFNPSVYFYPDGSTIEGAGLFDSTVTMLGIRVFDANGNQVFDVNATGSSGTLYSTRPVPEPATLVVLGLGVLAYRRRSRR